MFVALLAPAPARHRNFKRFGSRQFLVVSVIGRVLGAPSGSANAVAPVAVDVVSVAS